jgi:membrane protein DedA with SNARE-associated domain
LPAAACLTRAETVLIPVLALSISQALSELGYAGLVLLMIAETVFRPIPSEVVLPLATPIFVLLALGIGGLLLIRALRRRREA